MANALFLASLSHAAQNRIVEIASPEGVTLRVQPSASAEITKKLDVGDGVSVIRKATSEGLEWAYVKAEYCVKGNNCSNTGPGWIPDQDLAYESRFERISSWKSRRIEAGVADYWFTMDINLDGSVLLRNQPCLDCGETGECPDTFKKEGSECVARGHLLRYRNFVWAKGVGQFFFVNEQSELCSVYSGEDGMFCTSSAATQPAAAPDASRR